MQLWALTMKSSARLYHCARCHRQVVICSDCDRGNIYCAGRCAAVARRTSMRAAAQRYQHTYRGRLMHAARQTRYRAKIKKVTHHGSPKPLVNDLLSISPTTPKALENADLKPAQTMRCHFCQRDCGAFLRRSPLQRSYRPSCSGHMTNHRWSNPQAQSP